MYRELEEELKMAKEVSVRLHDELEMVEERRLKSEDELERVTDYLRESEGRRAALQREINTLHEEVRKLISIFFLGGVQRQISFWYKQILS